MNNIVNFKSSRPKVLLIGNGINLAFGDQSWKDMIQNELSESSSPHIYEQIKDVPSTMQIVLATNNNVDNRLKDIGRKMERPELSEGRIVFLRRLAALPADCILTANYGFEIERALGFTGSPAGYRSRLVRTAEMTASKDRFRLYQYYPLQPDSEGAAKQLWHIHGDIAKPNSMVMGHYYYGKIGREIQDRVSMMMKSYHGCLQHGSGFTPKSWVDWFLISDIYILGFGLYTCEADIWWLLCCKQRNFPDTRVYFYPAEMKPKDERALLLQAYGGKCMNGIAPPAGNNDYPRYYEKALEHMQQQMIS